MTFGHRSRGGYIPKTKFGRAVLGGYLSFIILAVIAFFVVAVSGMTADLLGWCPAKSPWECSVSFFLLPRKQPEKGAVP